MLVGSRKDSETYVRNKKKACDEVGIASFGETMSEDATEEEVLKVRYHANQLLACDIDGAVFANACIFYFQPHLPMLWQIC